MKDYIEERVLELARYITETGATVRSAAARFRVSKSTVHKDITERLLEINPGLAAEVKEVLEKNKAQRHIRGGLATRELNDKNPEETACAVSFRFYFPIFYVLPSNYQAQTADN